MKLFPLLPCLILLTVALLVPVLRSLGAKSDVSCNQYEYSKGVTYFSWFGVFFFIALPSVFLLNGTKFTVALYFVCSLFIVLMLIGSIYLSIYTVKLTSKSIYIRGFSKTIIDFSSIDKIVLYDGTKTSWIELWCYGKKVIIKNVVTDFNGLCRSILEHASSDVPVISRDRYGNSRPYVERSI